MKACINCKHFADGHFSKVYVSPRCKVRGDDDAMWMRRNYCTIDGIFYEAADMACKGKGKKPPKK